LCFVRVVTNSLQEVAPLSYSLSSTGAVDITIREE